MARRKKSLPPRRKRLKRSDRLLAARRWLTTFSGKHVPRAYSRWFGVDLGCALKELQLLGVELDPSHVAAIQRSLDSRRGARCRPVATPEVDDISDEYFAFIAGHTAGGAAYGITREDAEALGMMDDDRQ